jgi:hypothetical protein
VHLLRTQLALLRDLQRVQRQAEVAARSAAAAGYQGDQEACEAAAHSSKLGQRAREALRIGQLHEAVALAFAALRYAPFTFTARDRSDTERPVIAFLLTQLGEL